MVTMATGRFLSSAKNAKVLVVSPPKRIPAARLYSSGEVSRSTGEPITHTGQVFDQNDPRRARFVGRQKEVNKNFAIEMVAEEPVQFVEAAVACCDGGGGALGHPRVYINLDNHAKVGTCGYCGLRFKQGRAEQRVIMPQQQHGQAERTAYGMLKGMMTQTLQRLFSSIREGVSFFSKIFVRFKSQKK